MEGCWFASRLGLACSHPGTRRGINTVTPVTTGSGRVITSRNIGIMSVAVDPSGLPNHRGWISKPSALHRCTKLLGFEPCLINRNPGGAPGSRYPFNCGCWRIASNAFAVSGLMSALQKRMPILPPSGDFVCKAATKTDGNGSMPAKIASNSVAADGISFRRLRRTTPGRPAAGSIMSGC